MGKKRCWRWRAALTVGPRRRKSEMKARIVRRGERDQQSSDRRRTATVPRASEIGLSVAVMPDAVKGSLSVVNP